MAVSQYVYNVYRDATHFCHQCPPPKHLQTGVGPSVVQSSPSKATPCHSCLGEKGKIEKYVFPSSDGPSLPPKPSQTVDPPPLLSQVLLTKYAMARMRECQSDLAMIGHLHLHCQTEFGTNLTTLNRLHAVQTVISHDKMQRQQDANQLYNL